MISVNELNVESGEMLSPAIYVVPIGRPASDTLSRIAADFPYMFDVPVSMFTPSLDYRSAHDSGRCQYDANVLLRLLLNERPRPESKLLGITDLDLFVPILPFVFGQAQLRGQAAIVSTCRLRNAFYGLPEDFEAVAQRMEKEILHEMGHLFDLQHCGVASCVMHPSTSVSAIDKKGIFYCRRCRASLRY